MKIIRFKSYRSKDRCQIFKNGRSFRFHERTHTLSTKCEVINGPFKEFELSERTVKALDIAMDMFQDMFEGCYTHSPLVELWDECKK